VIEPRREKNYGFVKNQDELKRDECSDFEEILFF